MNKPAVGPFNSLPALQDAFNLRKQSFITRKDFHAVFDSGQAGGLTIDLFPIVSHLRGGAVSKLNPLYDSDDEGDCDVGMESVAAAARRLALGTLGSAEIAASNQLFNTMDVNYNGMHVHHPHKYPSLNASLCLLSLSLCVSICVSRSVNLSAPPPSSVFVCLCLPACM
jgi:hypothetical protein